jgi:hypothetical protein
VVGVRVTGARATALVGVYCGGVVVVDGELSFDRLRCRCEALLTPVGHTSLCKPRPFDGGSVKSRLPSSVA